MLILQQGQCAAVHRIPWDDAVTRLARVQHRALQLASFETNFYWHQKSVNVENMHLPPFQEGSKLS